jgi:formylglycine-generating enzyme required for sulfatase activity
VDSITWYQAMAFCAWLASHQATAGARLPTEEEWEYACRARSTTRYWSGDTEQDLERVGWYTKNSDRKTHEVGKKAPNEWGLHDMHGNVREWTVSPWTGDYSEQASASTRTVDPAALPAHLAAPVLRDARVIRGGGYWNDARNARSAFRNGRDPRSRGLDQGFRVLLPFAPSDHRS